MTKTSKPKSSESISTFSKNLSSLLTDRGISQRAAAGLAEVNPSVVSDWTSGSMPRDMLAVARLCKALKADFQWLLTGESSQVDLSTLRIEDLYDVETDASFSGVFMIEAKRLKRRGTT